MENATQALFLAATVLIFVMIISFAVWMFGSASSMGQKYDIQMSELDIQKYNAQFSEYEKEPKFINITDKTDIKPYNTDSLDKEYVLYDYNSISDVISVINKSYNRNAQTNYDIVKGVQVTIANLNCLDEKYKGVYGITPLYQKLYKESNKNDRNLIYKLESTPENKKITTDPSSFPSEVIDLNALLEKINLENKLVDGVDGKTRAYKYIFRGKVHINEDTGLIDIVNFECIINNLYDKYK